MLQFCITKQPYQLKIEIASLLPKHLTLLCKTMCLYFEQEYSVRVRKASAEVAIFNYDRKDVETLIAALTDWAVACDFGRGDNIVIATGEAVYSLPNPQKTRALTTSDLLTAFCQALNLDSSTLNIERIERDYALHEN